MILRKCTVCKLEKPLEDYYNSSSDRKHGKGYRCKPCDKIEREKNRQKNSKGTKLGYRRRALMWKYGLTLEQYDELLLKQGGVCAVCGTNNPLGEGNSHDKLSFSFAVDHCHDSGRVRGLLCNACNRGLGFFRDNPQFVLQAFKYICTK